MNNVDEVVSLAQKAESAKDWNAAAEFYRKAAEIQSEHANWHYRQGLSLERAKRFDDSIESYHVALKIEPRADWWRRLGASAEGANKLELAKEAYLTSLSFDPKSSEIERELLKNTPKAFLARLKILNWIREKIPIIKNLVLDHQTEASTDSAKIFVYWDGGFDRAPSVVQACYRELMRFHPCSEIHSLNAENWRYYVELPEHVIAKLPTNKAHFSDVLRVALLSRYGGTWIDATCMPARNLKEDFNERTMSGFFSYQVNGPRISNWFLCSSGDNYIPRMMLETLSEYWAENNNVSHYFMFHHMFEVLYYLDERFKSIWDGVRNKLNSREPHLLQKSMFSKYEVESFKSDYGSSAVHKLTYKYKDQIPTPDLVISHIVRRDF